MTMSNINNINFHIKGLSSNAVSIVESIANEDNALASLLKAQVNLLNNVINPCLTVCDFIDSIQSIIRTLKAITQKNNVLENKLRDTLSFIQNEGVDCLDCNNQFELLDNLNSVLESIGAEEFSIGCLISVLGKSIASIVCYCTFNDIKQVNNLVVVLMRLIVNLNTILLRELKTVVSLIKFIKDSELDIFIRIKKEMLCIIKNLIDSIFKEEIGLIDLIFGESVKISCALSMCLNEEELSELDSFITSFIDVVSDKRQVLEFKFSEVLSLLNTIGFSSCEIDFIMDHIKELQLIVSENKLELSKLIKDSSKELNGVIDKECCNYQELIDFNNCVTDKLIILLNAGCIIKSLECKICNSSSPCNYNNKTTGNY